MITLSFLKLLEDEGFGTIGIIGNEPGANLFFQKLTLDKVGIYIVDIGAPIPRGTRDVQPYELLARDINDVDGYKKLKAIRQYLVRNYSNICELPPVPDVTDYGYDNVEVTKPSTITNVGLDAKDRMVYSMTGQIIFKEK